MISTTCSLKWVNELQHEILSQLIIHSTLGLTLTFMPSVRMEVVKMSKLSIFDSKGSMVCTVITWVLETNQRIQLNSVAIVCYKNQPQSQICLILKALTLQTIQDRI